MLHGEDVQGRSGIQGAPRKGTCLAAANQSPQWQGVNASKHTPLWLAGTYRPSQQVPRRPCKTAPCPDKSRSTLWGPDVYLRAAIRYASIAATFLSLANTKLAPAQTRRNGRSKKGIQLQINLKPASLPSRANTAQLPVRASCIARRTSTCNSHCTQPLVRRCLYLRPEIVPGLTRRPQTRPCSMPCHAMQGTHRCHPHLHRNGARKETPQLALQSDSSHLEPAKTVQGPLYEIRCRCAKLKPPRANTQAGPTKHREPQASLRIRSLPVSYNTCRSELIRMLPRRRGRLVCRPSANVCT